MEVYSPAYISRCRKRLMEWGAPLDNWYCVEMYDIEEDYPGARFTCELCDCSNVRFVHVMRHDEYFEDVSVGCICAGIMDGDIIAAQERERVMRNRAKRKQNYLKKKWEWRANGNQVLWYKNQYITITPSQYGPGGFGVICGGTSVWRHKGKKISTFLSAVHAAFDLADPPIRGQRP